MSRSVTVITALAPVIGYAEAAKLAKQALATNEKVSDLVIDAGLLDEAQLEEILQPAKLAGIEPEPVTGAVDVSEIAKAVADEASTEPENGE